MRVKQLILGLFLFIKSTYPVFALEQVFVAGRMSTNMSTTTVQYNQVSGGDAFGSVENAAKQKVPIAGSISELRVTISGAPNPGGGIQSYAFVIMVNGVASALTCTISEDATSCTDISNRVSVAAGDLIDIRKTPSGTPTARAARWTTRYTTSSLTNSALIASTSNNNLSTSGVTFIPLNGGNAQPTEFQVGLLIPENGAISNLYCETSVAPGAGTSYIFTVRKNRSTNTVVTCTISGAAATTCSDLTDSFTVVAGDTVNISSRPTGTPTAAAAYCGAVFQASVAGDFIISHSGGANLSTSATEYARPSSNGNSYNATETNNQQSALYMTVKAIYVELSAAPNNGAGVQGYTFNFRRNAATTGPSCAITEDNTTCNNNTSVNLTANSDDAIATEKTITLTPTAVAMHHSYLANVAGSEWTLYGATIYGATLQ